MKRYMRKIAIALLAVMMFSSLAGYASASWANIDIDQNFTGNEYTKLNETGSKGDTTPVYLKLETGPNSTHRVQALGCASNNNSQTANQTQLENGTFVNYVTCFRGTQYSIHSAIKERGYSYATLSICPMGGSGWITGEWSPDSRYTYTHAAMTYN